MGYVLFTLRINMKQLDNENDNKDDFVNLYLRIITDYFQVISIISKIKLKFVYGIGEFFQTFSFVSDFLGNIFLLFSPIDCFYRFFGTNNNETDVLYFNLYLLLLFFPFLILINLLFWIVKAIITKNYKKWVLRRFFLVNFLVSYMFQQSFVNAYFRYINCTKIKEELYLRSYLIEKCWIGAHLFHFLVAVMPSLLFWMIIYPFIIIYFMRSKSKSTIFENSLSINIQPKYHILSFFTVGLKPSFYYWEILLMFRKYIFIILSLFPLTNDIILNLWILCIFSFVFLIFLAQKQPYENKKAFMISMFANLIILITFISLITLFIENNAYNQLMFLSIFATLNTFLFWKWGYDIYKMKKIAVIKKIQSLKQSLKNFFSQRKRKDLDKPSSMSRIFKKIAFSNSKQ